MEPYVWLKDDYFWNIETRTVCDKNGNVIKTQDVPKDLKRLMKLYGLILQKGIEKMLYSDIDINVKISELAQRINDDYANIKEPLIIVGILKGSFIFMADLVRRLTIPHIVDFMAVSSYGDKIENDGNVRIIMDCRVNQKGRDVLIVEDIVDSGCTLNYLVNNFKSRGTNSVKSATLLDKRLGRKVNFEADYVGFEIKSDDWVVGYGLDAAEKWRTLPYIAAIDKEGYKNGLQK